MTGSQFRNDLTRAIAYSLSARHEAAVETSYLLIFLALDTLIDALDRAVPLLLPADIKWNQLSKALCQCIDAHRLAHGLNVQHSDLIKEKLSELKRPALRRKLLFHLNQRNVITTGLWTRPDTLADMFEEGLGVAISYRNQLVHSAFVEDFVHLARHLARIRLLFDRLVLKVMGYDGPVESQANDDAQAMDDHDFRRRTS